MSESCSHTTSMREKFSIKSKVDTVGAHQYQGFLALGPDVNFYSPVLQPMEDLQ